MALYSPDTYEPFHKKYTHEQRVNGGKKRVSTARRDRWGRLLPNNDTVLPEPINHGRPGGLALVAKYGREHMSRIAKNRSKK